MVQASAKVIVIMKLYQICRLVSFPVTLSDSNLSFEVILLSKGGYLKHRAFYVVQLQIIHLVNLQCNMILMCGPCEELHI